MNDGTDLDKTNILHLVLGICTELKQNNLYSHSYLHVKVIHRFVILTRHYAISK